jgi:hypothetical protein
MDQRSQLPATQPAAPPAPEVRRVQVLNGVIELRTGRITVSDSLGVTLDVPINELRRVQFDIEAQRPATVAFVPASSRHAPVVLAVGHETYREVADVLVLIGDHLSAAEERPLD